MTKILPHRKSISNKAFTIVELLVAIAVVAILAGILIAVIGSGRERALEAQSASQLRQLGNALLLLAQDNQGNYEFRIGGSVGGGSSNVYQTWPLMLQRNPLFGELEFPRQAFWDDLSLVDFEDRDNSVNWHLRPSFGLNQLPASAEGSLPWRVRRDGNLRIGMLNINVIDEPNKRFLLGTSMQSSGRGAHTIRMVNTAASPAGSIQARFRKDSSRHALLYYFDGRVSSADDKELTEQGFTSGYGANPSEIISFTTSQ